MQFVHVQQPEQLLDFLKTFTPYVNFSLRKLVQFATIIMMYENFYNAHCLAHPYHIIGITFTVLCIVLRII